jgi:hypothetical protein
MAGPTDRNRARTEPAAPSLATGVTRAYAAVGGDAIALGPLESGRMALLRLPKRMSKTDWTGSAQCCERSKARSSAS